MGCDSSKDGKPKHAPLNCHQNTLDNPSCNDFEGKVVLLGDSGVGKSSIATRFSKDTFKEDYEVTIGGSYFQSQVAISSGAIVKLHIWDTGGAERFRSMAHIYYKDAASAIFVYG